MAVARSAAIASLRKLAVLGLPGPMLREALAATMRELVPGDLVCFIRHDTHFGALDGWLNFPEMLPDFGVYLSQYYNSREAEAHLTFREFWQRGILIERMHASAAGNYLRSELYHEIYRPYDFRYSVRFALRNAGGTARTVTVTRGHGTRDYTSEEINRLLAAAPFLTHALESPVEWRGDQAAIETAEGHLICDAAGRIEYASAQGRALLHDIADVPMTGATLTDRCLAWATDHLGRLVGDAARLAAGRPGDVPVLVRNTPRGRYVLRLWRLASGRSDQPGLYSISIRRYVPMALRLLESPTVIGLPAREKSVCLMLAEGRETKEIAADLGLSPNTVISYIRGLYRRLGIAGRHELLARLLPEPEPAKAAGCA